MNYKEKQQIIQKGIFYLRTRPKGKNMKKRKSHIRAFHLNNSKIFFDIFIAKTLQKNINDQFRRLEKINILTKILSQKPISRDGKHIFIYKEFLAVIIENIKTVQKKKIIQHNLLTFYPQ